MSLLQHLLLLYFSSLSVEIRHLSLCGFFKFQRRIFILNQRMILINLKTRRWIQIYLKRAHRLSSMLKMNLLTLKELQNFQFRRKALKLENQKAAKDN